LSFDCLAFAEAMADGAIRCYPVVFFLFVSPSLRLLCGRDGSGSETWTKRKGGLRRQGDKKPLKTQ